MTRVAVIGAGIAGLTLARELGERADVRVFEKSRGVGGRMATRRADPYQFDHGAQFFTARSDEFIRFVEPFVERGQVARWEATFVEIVDGRIASRREWADGPAHYVGVPRMNALARQLARGVDIELRTRVSAIDPAPNGWRLRDERGDAVGQFDWVVVAIPAAQALELLPSAFEARREIAAKSMLGCYSLMLGFEQPLPLEWQAAFVGGADISWISNDSSKPGRPQAYTLLVHSTNRWAEANLEADSETVKAYLADETTRATGVDVTRAAHVGLHRWRYANIARQNGDGYLIDPQRRLGAIGDWCIHGRIEAAWQSARRLGQRLGPLL